jgi:hypothetical protein
MKPKTKGPKKRAPIKALRPPLYGIWMPAAACNAAEARHRGGEWLTWGMVVTDCDEKIGTVAVWRSRSAARREIEEFNLRYPKSACVDAARREYGHEIRLYCRLGDHHGRRGRPAKSDIGRLAEESRADEGAESVDALRRSCAMPKRG